MSLERLKDKYPFINSKPFKDYNASEFAEHLREIINHTQRVKRAKKEEAKKRSERYKVEKEPIYVTFRITKTGKGSIIIRKRKPPYILVSELEGIKKEFPTRHKEIAEAIEKREIPIKEDPKKKEK